MLTKPTFAVNNIQGLADLVEDQATELKVLFDKTGADTKTYLISLCDQLDLDFATKVDLANAIISSAFPAGSIGDSALSNLSGQIKERLQTHIDNDLKHAPDTIGTAGQSLVVNSAADGTEWAKVYDGAWEKIAEQTLTSAVAQVDFASIPSGYKNLRLFIDARCDSTTSPGELRMLLNNDAGANYQGASSTTAYVSFGAMLSIATNAFGFAMVNISNFNALQFKRLLINSMTISTGISNSQSAFSWRNSTTEINKISLYGVSVLLNVGSRFVLWGCK